MEFVIPWLIEAVSGMRDAQCVDEHSITIAHVQAILALNVSGWVVSGWKGKVCSEKSRKVTLTDVSELLPDRVENENENVEPEEAIHDVVDVDIDELSIDGQLRESSSSDDILRNSNALSPELDSASESSGNEKGQEPIGWVIIGQCLHMSILYLQFASSGLCVSRGSRQSRLVGASPRSCPHGSSHHEESPAHAGPVLSG